MGTQTPEESPNEVVLNRQEVSAVCPYTRLTILDTSQEPLAGGRWSLPHVQVHNTRDKWFQEMTNAQIQSSHNWSADEDCLRIPYYMFEGSGLQNSGGRGHDLVLFNRPACKKQIKFILESVVGNGDNGIIRGQPGTGKSGTTFFVCCSLRFEYDIVWVNMDAVGYANVVTMQGEFIRKTQMNANEFAICVSDLLDDPNRRTRKIILILDSFNIANNAHLKLVCDGAKWRAKDSVYRRIITVSSMAESLTNECVISDDFEWHGVESWKLDEFISAVQHEEMWESVKEVFTDPRLRLSGKNDGSVSMTRVELVRAKFYYAGVSARFMFGTTVGKIIATLSGLVRSLSLARRETTLSGLIYSPEFKHTCMSFSCNSPNDFTQNGFVSQFVARAVGVVSRSRDIRALVEECNLGPQARGWMFEAFFLACVAESEDMVLEEVVNETHTVRVTWSSRPNRTERVVRFDPHNMESMIPINTWMYSNNAGYDAVMLLENGIIRFIQATIGNKHDLKMWALADLVKRLRKLGHVVSAAEIVFVIPDGLRAGGFKITELISWKSFGTLFNIKTQACVKKMIKTVLMKF